MPPGNYVVYGQLVNDNSAGAISGTASVKLIVAGAGATGQTPTSYGTVAAGTQVTVPFQGTAHLPSGGSIGYDISYMGTPHWDLTAVRVAAAERFEDYLIRAANPTPTA